jgi:hypothetical protein
MDLPEITSIERRAQRGRALALLQREAVRRSYVTDVLDAR